jgi:D-beta-D-heptose 7-phosphate kinase/D-beta-D-heptose 1-phosphate adenosyltransferase
MTSLTQLLDAIAHPRILVLGDLILDRYTFGNAERVSPEAPVIVLRVDAKEVRLGGAASVAMLLRALEADVALAGVVGDDPEGRTLLKLLDDEQIDRSMVLVDADRPTTVKERFVGRCASRSAAGGQQMLRVDHETHKSIDTGFEERLALETATRLESPWGRAPECETDRVAEQRRFGKEWIPPGLPSEGDFAWRDASFLYSHISYDAILISDYAKGVCTERLLQMVLAKAGERRVPVIIDPARIADFGRYRYATLLKPNRFEAELAAGRKIVTPDDALAAAEELRGKLKVESVLITLDHDGMVCVAGSLREPNVDADVVSRRAVHFPVAAREVYDITGAGDMVLAVLGLCLASNVPLAQAAQLANIAAGLEVQKLGVAPITRIELIEAATYRSHPSQSSIPDPASTSLTKLIDRPAAVQLANSYRAQGKSIVFTNGCFDLLHVGHVTMLEQAAALGEVLVVAINSDAGVRRLKGPERPVVREGDRARMLAALHCVDHVLIFDEPTPHKLLEAIRPNVLVKGGTTAEITGHEVVESYGGRVHHLDAVPGISTTTLISRTARTRVLPFERSGQPLEAASCRLIVSGLRFWREIAVFNSGGST